MEIIKYDKMDNSKLIKLPVSSFKYIVIHHAKAKKASPDDIYQWHVIGNGWSNPAYAEYITKDGTVYFMRGFAQQSANKGYNRTSYNICLEGDFDKELPTKKQLNALAERTKKIMKTINIDHNNVKKHVDFGNTASCPGVKFPWEQFIDSILSVNWVSWDVVIRKVSTNPDSWIKAINTIEKVSKLGIFKEFKYLKLLIEKIYNNK
jgi:hypothetical protein